MMYEWDSAKAARNAAKHRVTFPYAVRVFEDPKHCTWEDKRKPYGEKRFISLGKIEGRVFVIVHTVRGKNIRIISARKGNSDEKEIYDRLLRSKS